MKETKYRVELFYGGEVADEVRETNDIEEARRWVANAEHGLIFNEQGISVQ